MAFTCGNVVKKTQLRELKEDYHIRFRRSTHVTPDLIQRLGLQAELDGHAGCVNCLSWNEKGSLLASGSDDVQVIIWDPFRKKQLTTIRTGHNGNIFSVKFLPQSGDNIVASSAADCKIRVHDVTSHEVLHVFGCHAGRVKRLATSPSQPNVFWSASEDGTVMEFDLRAPEMCKTDRPQNVLINLNEHVGPHAEAKCLSINPVRPELLAVGANDPYVRLYDRRMLHCRGITFPADTPARFIRSRFRSSSPVPDQVSPPVPPPLEDDYRLPDNCVTYFVAGHLPQKQHDYRRKYRTLASTYVTFGPDGNELLVNLGGEQIYLFDVNRHQLPQRFDISMRQKISPAVQSEFKEEPSNGFNVICHGNGLTANGVSKHVASATVDAKLDIHKTPPPSKRTKYCTKPLPAAVEAVKLKANAAFEQEKYNQAIKLYNQALSMCADQPVLYGNRAAAYLKRSWDGDVYAALRDCYTALQLDVNHVKAHFRLARCLYELSWTTEALECLLIFKAKFPDSASSKTCEALEKDIRAAIFSKNSGDNTSSPASSAASHSPTSRWRDSTSLDATSEQERTWRSAACDYELRFCGHCNTTTDIKEANFFGSNGQYVVAGSDDGSFFIWEKSTTNIVRILRGDESIVNCLEPHPVTCLLATSGIDPYVRLWSPLPDDGQKNEREVDNSDDAALANQKRMNADPLEVMLSNMGYRITNVLDDDGSGEREGGEGSAVGCRAS